MKYHLFISNEEGSFYSVFNTKKEVKEHCEDVGLRHTDILGVVRGGSEIEIDFKEVR